MGTMERSDMSRILTRINDRNVSLPARSFAVHAGCLALEKTGSMAQLLAVAP
jgi:hypothetical protein